MTRRRRRPDDQPIARQGDRPALYEAPTASAFEKPQKGNPHELTIRQHIHSRACIARFADAAGLVGVKRVASPGIFRVRPENEVFVAKRAWSHRLEHGLFCEVEARFQHAIDSALAGGDVDHQAVTDYAIIWALRDHFNSAGRDSIQLVGVGGSELTQDQEEILERQGCLYVRAGGILPAHMSRDLSVLQRYDMNRAELRNVRWRLGATPDSMRLLCPDAYRSAGLGIVPINPTHAFVASLSEGPAAEMSQELVRRVNRQAIVGARSLVFANPDDLAALLSA